MALHIGAGVQDSEMTRKLRDPSRAAQPHLHHREEPNGEERRAVLCGGTAFGSAQGTHLELTYEQERERGCKQRGAGLHWTVLRWGFNVLAACFVFLFFSAYISEVYYFSFHTSSTVLRYTIFRRGEF